MVPDSVEDYAPGKENVFAGKGEFYRLKYGSYLIAMNCTEDKNFVLDIPESFVGAQELVSGSVVSRGKVSAGPLQTMVLYKR